MNVILFPYVRRVWRVNLSPKQVQRRLKQVLLVEEAPMPRQMGDHYRGTVEEDHFRFRRAINYTNYFLPAVQGRVLADGDGATVRMLVSPKLLVLSLEAIWALFWIQLFFMGLLVPEVWISPMTSAAIFVVTYGLMLANFQAEARRVERFLTTTLGVTA